MIAAYGVISFVKYHPRYKGEALLCADLCSAAISLWLIWGGNEDQKLESGTLHIGVFRCFAGMGQRSDTEFQKC